MKSILKLSCVIFVMTFLFSSCTMQKRVYMSGYNIEMNNGVNKTNKKEFAENKAGKAVKAEKSKNVEAEVVQEQPEALIAYDAEETDKNLMSTTENSIVLSSSSKTNYSKIESTKITSKKKSISSIKSYLKARMHQPAINGSSNERNIIAYFMFFIASFSCWFSN